MCGDTNKKGKHPVESFGGFHLCLVLPDPKDITKLKKVGFYPILERMDSLEIRGLYDLYKDVDDVQVRALSQGVISRPSYIKKEGQTAELLNLVVKMENGTVSDLEWRNQCIDRVCSFEDCKQTIFF